MKKEKKLKIKLKINKQEKDWSFSKRTIILNISTSLKKLRIAR